MKASLIFSSTSHGINVQKVQFSLPCSAHACIGLPRCRYSRLYWAKLLTSNAPSQKSRTLVSRCCYTRPYDWIVLRGSDPCMTCVRLDDTVRWMDGLYCHDMTIVSFVFTFLADGVYCRWASWVNSSVARGHLSSRCYTYSWIGHLGCFPGLVFISFFLRCCHTGRGFRETGAEMGNSLVFLGLFFFSLAQWYDH